MAAATAPITIHHDVEVTFSTLTLRGDIEYHQGHQAMFLVTDDGEPPETLTISLAGYGVWPSLPEHVFIKDYSEGSGITESLVKAGVVRIVGSLLVGPFQSRVYEVEIITGNDEEEGA